LDQLLGVGWVPRKPKRSPVELSEERQGLCLEPFIQLRAVYQELLSDRLTLPFVPDGLLRVTTFSVRRTRPERQTRAAS
jgi:hypothetical protein